MAQRSARGGAPVPAPQLDPGLTVLVTGAAGYLGRRLVRRLGELGCATIKCLDLRFGRTQTPAAEGRSRLEYFNVDLSQGDLHAELRDVLHDVQVVFHLASYGMSGAAMLDVSLVRKVNVAGTRQLLRASRESGTTRAFVYCSTYNTVFNGSAAIERGACSTLPYVDGVDAYSQSKREAEELVLQDDDTGGSPKALRTVAIRPNAIYGEGEERHLPRIVDLVNKGLGFFAIGDPSVETDWVYVENLVHGLVCGAVAVLEPHRRDAAAGRAFAVSDGAPVNNFWFLRQLLGDDSLFAWYAPTWAMALLGALCELMHGVIGPYFPFEPFLTRAEVFKVGVTHHMSLEESLAGIGYHPLVPQHEAIRETRRHYAPLLKPPGTGSFLAALALALAALAAMFHCAGRVYA